MASSALSYPLPSRRRAHRHTTGEVHMTDLMADPKAATTTAPVADETEHEELVEEELLVEDVSIDGMCGVY